MGASNDISKNQNSSAKCPIYSNSNSNNLSSEMQIDQTDNDIIRKRSKYDLKLRDQKLANYSVELNSSHEFKQDVMIISFEGNSNGLNTSCINNTNNNKKLVSSSLDTRQLTESENKLLGLANIALERETN